MEKPECSVESSSCREEFEVPTPNQAQESRKRKRAEDEDIYGFLRASEYDQVGMITDLRDENKLFRSFAPVRERRLGGPLYIWDSRGRRVYDKEYATKEYFSLLKENAELADQLYEII